MDSKEDIDLIQMIMIVRKIQLLMIDFSQAIDLYQELKGSKVDGDRLDQFDSHFFE